MKTLSVILGALVISSQGFAAEYPAIWSCSKGNNPKAVVVSSNQVLQINDKEIADTLGVEFPFAANSGAYSWGFKAVIVADRLNATGLDFYEDHGGMSVSFWQGAWASDHDGIGNRDRNRSWYFNPGECVRGR